jgi:acarbose 7IV-phosphotransferase
VVGRVASRRSGVPRVVVFGAASWNTLISVGAFPPPVPASVFPTAWHEAIGSSGAGKAMNLARLGIDVTLHCLLGDDEAGNQVRAGLEAAGVTVDARIDRTGTARHVNLMDAVGGRLSFLLHTGDPAAALDANHIEALMQDADHVLVEIIDQARPIVAAARRLGRPVWTDLHDTDGERAHDRGFVEADAVVLSTERLADPRPFMKRLVEAGRHLVVATSGAAGALALTADGRWLSAPAAFVDPELIVDTNGAGDAFTAGVLYGELNGLPIVTSLRIGARVAALAVQSPDLASADLTTATVADLVGGSR